MPARTVSRSRDLAPWPTLTLAEALALGAKGDAALREALKTPDRPRNVLPLMNLPGSRQYMERLVDRLALTAEARGALPLWQKTGMA